MGMPVCHLWGISRPGIPSGSWAGVLMESVIPLIGSTSLECSLTVLFVALWLLPTPHSYSSLLSTLGGARDSWASLAKSHTAGRHSLTCSHFPPRVNHGSQRSHLALSCATSGGDDSGKVKWLLLPSPMYSVSGVFVPVMYWNFYAGNLDFHIEAMGDYLRSFSPGALSSWEDLEPVHWPLQDS